MENKNTKEKEKKGIFSKLFSPKSSCCCNVKIIEENEEKKKETEKKD